MKICHISTVHPPFDVRIFYKECVTLARSGFKVTLLAQHGNEIMIGGVKVIPLPIISGRIKRMLVLPLTAFFIALKQKADIYHFHDPELLPVGVLLKIFTLKKVIYDIHEDYAKQTLSKNYIPSGFRTILSWFISIMERFSILFFDGIIAATDSILEKFSSIDNAVCIHNFPIISSFSDLEKSIVKKDESFKLIYAGGLVRIRGISELVRSMEYLPGTKNIRLDLCGKFETEKYEKEIRTMDGFKKVEYKGWVKPEEIPSLLMECDAGVVCFLPEPNHVNAMPNKIFEYMLAGLPVIASNFPLWKKIIVENSCGMCVDPMKPDQIAKAIEFLFDHPVQADEMGQNGKKAVREFYNWEKEGEKLVMFYNKI